MGMEAYGDDATMYAEPGIGGYYWKQNIKLKIFKTFYC